jgi:pimeloyl-ACP methyl ester carboxylesterase
MGGMIAQLMATRHPGPVLSLASIMSTTGHRFKGQPALKVYPTFLAKPPRTKDEAVDGVIKLFRVVGSPGFERDEDHLRDIVRRSFDRAQGDTSGSARQLAAILASRDRAADLARITVPTVVIHGTADRLVRPSGGRATARAIPGARLVMIEGMGHDLPRGVWPRVLGEIDENITLVGAPAPVAP